ncbi:SGNH/GDSL hydrolase family protein [Vibrio sp. JC009]|uniref:SGNH/GDSL hydrolase family protein n=1 Tax=Vibrio sp. JC009 TaxID=2912314 RepID=UPI0023B0BBA9|nr:SGNH/GDSL hydrolase family protein [Vibrio sp. JC009]WED24820.1 SGNH/GDSL hydrolase family protein [Vibrio sp. JC009]
MKSILCFGDSNTWGYSPADGGRYPKNRRWTGILAGKLSDKYHVIEEGQPGRTTLFDDPSAGFTGGRDDLKLCMETHQPDIVILMLGTNDLKANFNQSASDVAGNLATLVRDIKASSTAPAKIVLISPPEIEEVGHFGQFFVGGKEKSQHFTEHFRKTAAELDCLFFDSKDHVKSSPVDGVHWEADQHQNMAYAIAIKLEDYLK